MGVSMNENKAVKNGYWILAAFMMILGIIGVIISGREAVGYLKSPVNLNSISSDELDDVTYGKVELSKTFLYGCFDVSYEMENGLKTPKSYSYILYIGDYAAGDAKFIGISVNENNIEVMDKIVDESWEAIQSGEPLEEFSELELKGKFRKMTEDEYTNMIETLTDMGIESSVAQENIVRLVLDENGTTDSIMFILFGMGVSLIVIGIVWLICLMVIWLKRNSANIAK